MSGSVREIREMTPRGPESVRVSFADGYQHEWAIHDVSVEDTFEQIRQTPDQPSALARGHLPPGSVAIFKCPPRRDNRTIDIRC